MYITCSKVLYSPQMHLYYISVQSVVAAAGTKGTVEMAVCEREARPSYATR